jgi:endonuclease/exonuclease/phosphatase family metal-dependent hydrolase
MPIGRRLLPLLAMMLLLTSPLPAAAADPAPSPPPRDPRTLRVMTYNIHITQGMDKKFDPARIAKIINDADVDVAAIQEVDRDANRSGKVDQPAELARLTGMKASFAKAIPHDGGEYGQLVLSKRPIQRFDVHVLPNQPGEEQRIAFVAEIAQPGPLPDLLLVGTHLHAKGGTEGDALRLAQAKALDQLIREDPRKPPQYAALLMGDLNATPTSESMRVLEPAWVDASADSGPTVPVGKPVRKIDYVLLPKGQGWRVVSAKVLDEPVASDHRPVVVELRWDGDPAPKAD